MVKQQISADYIAVLNGEDLETDFPFRENDCKQLPTVLTTSVPEVGPNSAALTGFPVQMEANTPITKSAMPAQYGDLPTGTALAPVG